MQRAAAAGDVAQWRVFQKTELFPDVQFFGAQLGGDAFVPPGIVATLDDLVCRRAQVFSQRHGAPVFHGGEPRHNQIRDALPADCNLPQDRNIAVWASDDRFCWATPAERALVDSVSPDCFPSALAGREFARHNDLALRLDCVNLKHPLRQIETNPRDTTNSR